MRYIYIQDSKEHIHILIYNHVIPSVRKGQFVKRERKGTNFPITLNDNI